MDRYFTMRDHDETSTPSDTPPTIGCDTNVATSLNTAGERKGRRFVHAADNKAEIEKALGPAQDGGQEGSGEAALARHHLK